MLFRCAQDDFEPLKPALYGLNKNEKTNERRVRWRGGAGEKKKVGNGIISVGSSESERVAEDP
jgi:hypothetical protein